MTFAEGKSLYIILLRQMHFTAIANLLDHIGSPDTSPGSNIENLLRIKSSSCPEQTNS